MLRLRFMFAIALSAFAALPAHATPSAPTAPAGTARLRTQSPRVANWLARGRQRSPTLRALADQVEQVERGDVVVHLEIAFQLDPGMAACVTWMASMPGARYERIGHRTGGGGRTWDTVAALRGYGRNVAMPSSG